MEILDCPLVTCEAVLSESCYLLRKVAGAPLAVLSNVEGGRLDLPFQLARVVPAIRAIMQKYRDIPADFADACLIYMADQLDTGDILTLDSDFLTYRWRRNRPFEMLIPPVR
jgi:predicted nucleic acid-binding protein